MLNNQAALYAGVQAVAIGDFESIATVTVGAGGSSSISFTSIPSSYSHLQIRMMARCGSTAGGGNYLSMNFNSDAGSNYSYHAMNTEGAGSASAAGLASQGTVYLQRIANDNDTSGTQGVLITDILNYASTSINKTVRSLGGFDANGSGRIYINSSVWLNASNAISSITIAPESSVFKEYSSFALYGIKG